jgi:hypothetical protein
MALTMASESALLLSSIVSNGAFIGISAFFVKRWMDKVDASTEKIYRERKEDAASLAKDLRDTAKEHQKEVVDTTVKIERHLDQIYNQLRIANGRTAKIEGGLQKVEAVCAERHQFNGTGKTGGA